MPQPFNVRSQDKPGIDLGSWDKDGNITIPGTLTAGGVVGGGGGGTVTSVTALDSTVTIGGTAAAVTVGVNTIAESKVTNLVTDLGLKAPLASPAFTGAITSAGTLVLTVDAFTSVSGTVTPDCSTSNYFRYSMTGNTTVAAPTNAVDGQKITFEFIQDATGSRTVTLNAAFNFGTSITSYTATTTASKRDKIGVIYNAAAAKFDVVAVALGFS